MNPGPNILWVVTTQWRAQATGYSGDTNAFTPAIDALAARSVNYRQAVTPHPFGPFARAAMLTGLLSPENGVRDYYDPLPRDRRTIAHELGEAGYATAFFGKWHLGEKDRAAALVGEAHARTLVPPDARGGFDFWEGFEGGFMLNDPWLHGTRLPAPVRFKGYQADVLVDRAAAWIDDQEETAKMQRHSGGRRPWFCVLSLESPHPPYDAPAAGVEPSGPGEIALPANVPRGGETEDKARRELAGYYAHIQATDRALGRLFAKTGVRDTAVLFTSAHGDMHGAHGCFRKGWPYEEAIRVPLLVCLPDGVAGVSDAAVSLADLPAITKSIAMENRLPEIKAGRARISMPCVVRLPHQCDRIWSGWRSPENKEVFNADGTPWMRYDLRADPLEMDNLVGRPSGG